MPSDLHRATRARTRRIPLDPARRPRAHPPAGLALLLLAVLSLPAPAGAVTQAGGDDVVAARQVIITPTEDLTCLEIAGNGDAYALYGELNADNEIWKLHVLRSTNRGTTWTEWGAITDANPDIRFHGATLHLAEGFHSRLYVVYTYAPTDQSSGGLRVAYSTLGLSSASFTTHTVLTSVLYLFQEPSLTSDAVNFNDYRLYLAYRGAGVDFIRSTDYGDTWSSPVEVAPYTTSTWSLRPELRYGTGGNLHCVWHSVPADHAQDSVLVKYRRATDYGADASDWQSPVTLTPVVPDVRYGTPTVAASHSSGNVTVVYDVERYNGPTATWVKSRAKLRLTRDHGASWAAADTAIFGSGCYSVHSLALPDGQGFVYASESSGRAGLFKTSDASPLVPGDFLRLADRDYSDYVDTPPSLDYDGSDGDRVGLLWHKLHGTTADSLLFDAEWRGDPGYPRLEAGFPKTLASPATTPPALALVDGDAQQEIVFGCYDGTVQVLDKDGNSLPGWPQDIGSFPANGAVAVGDLDGDGQNEIVAGNTAGQVYAFRGNGTLVAGWPRDLGTGMDAFVSIGALSADSHRQVVACSARQLHVLLADGSPLSGFPRTVNDTLRAPAAIGDVNGDGQNEIVLLYGSTVRVEHLTQSQTVWTSFRGKTFAVVPSLADVDLDGDLEIVAPTEQGDIYLLRHDLSAYGNGWPFSAPSLGPITSAALADAYGTSEPEIFVGQRDSSLRVFQVTPESEARPSPYHVGLGVSVFAMPIVETLDDSTRAVVFGSLNANAYAWPALSVSQQPGWPRGIGSDCYLTPASGDIDADGRVEVVFLASQKLTVFDVGGRPVRNDPLDHWPMYGYNAQRTFCLGCLPDVVTAAPGEELPTLVRFAPPAPNPVRGAARFSFVLPRAAAVRLTLYDLDGRVVRALVKEELPAGAHEARWDGRGADGRQLADGVYFARLSVADTEGGKVLTRKVTLLR